MINLVLDFRYFYDKGERRSSDSIAYQWDLGHVAKIYVPEMATYEIHYSFPNYTETEAYAIDSIAADDDGGYVITAHIPNTFFERSGELSLYVVGSADDQVLMTYEGYITIHPHIKPADYIDDDPNNGARTIIEQAETYRNESEAWARGTIEGEAVPSTADQYQNNSKYYSEQSAQSATNAGTSETNAGVSATAAAASEGQAEAWATGEINGTPVASDADQYQNNSEYYATQASGSASAASGSATAAATSEDNAEAWAVGQINGTDVGSSDARYHNNSKYYSEQSANSATAAAASAASIVVDTAMSGSSTNMVQNKVIKSYVDNAIDGVMGDFATIEDDSIAVNTYEAGEYLINNNLLYKTIDDIAVGDDLEVGVNIKQTTVGSEVASLSEDLTQYHTPSDLVTRTSGTGLTLEYRTVGNLVFGIISGTPTYSATVPFTVPKALVAMKITEPQWGSTSNPMQVYIDAGETTLNVRNYSLNTTTGISFCYLKA